MYFGSRVQKVVYFPSDNSDLLSSHFSVQSEVHYFWTASARILVYSQKQSILRACRVCRSHLSELSQPLIFCFVPLPVLPVLSVLPVRLYPYCRYYRYVCRDPLRYIPINSLYCIEDAGGVHVQTGYRQEPCDYWEALSGGPD